MNLEMHNKIAATHLQRQAYLYVRQSTLRQVLENTESTKRQYALRERAVALGWPLDRAPIAIAWGSRSWWPRSAWARSAWYSALRSPGWPAAHRIGTGCLRSAR
jgi:hypothetical protein